MILKAIAVLFVTSSAASAHLEGVEIMWRERETQMNVDAYRLYCELLLFLFDLCFSHYSVQKNRKMKIAGYKPFFPPFFN